MEKIQYYHVVFPTYKRLPLLINSQYKATVVGVINKIKEEKIIKIDLYNILTNHAHLLISKTAEETLSQLIKIIKGRTTYYFYQTYPDFKIDIGRGKLWARGYHYTKITSDRQLKVTQNYIRNNFDCYKDEK